MKHESQCFIMVWKHEKALFLNLFGMFLDHDETGGASVSYDFSISWEKRSVTFLFTIVGLIIQIVI